MYVHVHVQTHRTPVFNWTTYLLIVHFLLNSHSGGATARKHSSYLKPSPTSTKRALVALAHKLAGEEYAKNRQDEARKLIVKEF